MRVDRSSTQGALASWRQLGSRPRNCPLAEQSPSGVSPIRVASFRRLVGFYHDALGPYARRDRRSSLASRWAYIASDGRSTTTGQLRSRHRRCWRNVVCISRDIGGMVARRWRSPSWVTLREAQGDLVAARFRCDWSPEGDSDELGGPALALPSRSWARDRPARRRTDYSAAKSHLEEHWTPYRSGDALSHLNWPWMLSQELSSPCNFASANGCSTSFGCTQTSPRGDRACDVHARAYA
jgi:hypothetical protein